MQLRITDFIQPNIIEQTDNYIENQYSYTVKNQGKTGKVRVEYYYLQSVDSPLPDRSAAFGGDEHPEVTLESAETVTMEEGEVRTFEMTKEENDPRENLAIYVIPASLGGVVENNADASGDIEIRLEINESAEYDVEDPEPIQTTIDSHDEARVMFDVLIPENASYEMYPEVV
jgi:hypothetical protein